ncbi:hypothetical protein L596_005805 [Steinernema carpocapsae]|uniref:Uncharacterized protein n=1 Tax=Steinernema carpocapsae TaxID=34508 RepID=A0A4U8V068_STECR|nr:hypothetical protein L596_005805 [Steinernema carpocapsae]
MPVIKLFNSVVDFALWNFVRLLFVRLAAYVIVLVITVGKWELWILPNIAKGYSKVIKRICPLYVWERRNYRKTIYA